MILFVFHQCSWHLPAIGPYCLYIVVLDQEIVDKRLKYLLRHQTQANTRLQVGIFWTAVSVIAQLIIFVHFQFAIYSLGCTKINCINNEHLQCTDDVHVDVILVFSMHAIIAKGAVSS